MADGGWRASVSFGYSGRANDGGRESIVGGIIRGVRCSEVVFVDEERKVICTNFSHDEETRCVNRI